MATFATTVNLTEVANTVNNQSFVAPIATVNTAQPVFARPTMNLTRFPVLSGAINSPPSQFVNSPTIRPALDSNSDCACQGAAETSNDAVEEMEKAIQPGDLESLPAPEAKGKKIVDEVFEDWDIYDVEGFERTPLLEDGNKLNSLPSNNNMPVAPNSSVENDSAAMFGTVGVLGLATVGAFSMLRRD